MAVYTSRLLCNFVRLVPAGFHTTGAISSKGCSMLNTVGRGSLQRKAAPQLTTCLETMVHMQICVFNRFHLLCGSVLPWGAELCVSSCAFSFQQKSKFGRPDIWNLRKHRKKQNSYIVRIMFSNIHNKCNSCTSRFLDNINEPLKSIKMKMYFF